MFNASIFIQWLLLFATRHKQNVLAEQLDSRW